MVPRWLCTSQLAGLLAAVSASRVVAALIPILGLVALALASTLILTAAPSAVLVLWVGFDFLFLREPPTSLSIEDASSATDGTLES